MLWLVHQSQNQDNHISKIFSEGEFLVFALDQSMGQYDYFDYLVLFNDNLEIISVKFSITERIMDTKLVHYGGLVGLQEKKKENS